MPTRQPASKPTPKQLRSDYITVRMGPAVKAELSRRAKIMGMSISTYALFLIAASIEPVLIPPPKGSDHTLAG